MGATIIYTPFARFQCRRQGWWRLPYPSTIKAPNNAYRHHARLMQRHITAFMGLPSQQHQFDLLPNKLRPRMLNHMSVTCQQKSFSRGSSLPSTLIQSSHYKVVRITTKTNSFDSTIIVHKFYFSTVLVVKILRFAILLSKLWSDSKSLNLVIRPQYPHFFA